MKTVRIEVYKAHGTRSTYGVIASYKGKEIISILENSPNLREMVQRVISDMSANYGFDRYSLNLHERLDPHESAYCGAHDYLI